MNKIRMVKRTDARLPRHSRPLRYTLQLTPDTGSHTFEGHETIFYTLDRASKSITLHALEITVHRASTTVGGRVEDASISYKTKNETVTFTFSKPVPKGKGALDVTFSGTLNNKMRGFYRSDYEVAGVPHTMAVTQFESTYARYAFPCVDEPAVKAVFDVTLIVPKDHVAISNTLPTETATHSSTHQRVTFSPSPQMSTYLLAFVVGKFEWLEEKSKNGTLVRVFVTPGRKHEATFALDVAVRSLEFYEKYFGIKYPLPALDNIAIPDFSSGAMENWGAITYREAVILVHEEKSSAANKQRVALVIAHEIAHQWFGNLVTMSWWTDLWLNEGFATYIEYLAVDALFPTWDIWTQFSHVEQSQAFQLDGLHSTHPIEVPVHHPSEISEIFDAVSYAKGASIIRMLADYLGKKDFRKGLHTYLTTHAYKNTVTDDLWKAFERASGKPVKRIMSCWTKAAGYPVVTVSSEHNAMRLSQSRFYSSRIASRKSKDKTVWNIPMRMLVGSSSKELLFSTKRATTKMHARMVNAGAAGFYRTNYSAPMLEALEHSIRTKRLLPRERLIVLNDVFALAEAGVIPLSAALEHATTYKNEDDYSVWAALLHAIGRVGALLEGTPAKKDYDAFVRKLVERTTKKVGWVAKPNESHSTKLLRSQVLLAYGNAGDKQTIATAKKFFARAKRGRPLDSDLRTTVFWLAAQNGGEREFNDFVRMYENETVHIEKNRILQSLGSFRKPALVKRAIEYALSPAVRFQDSRWVFMMAWSSEPGSHVAWELTKKHWATLTDRYGTAGHDLQRYVGWVGALKTVNDLREARAFFRKREAPGAERTLMQALESIESNIDWLKRDLAPVAKWLKTD